MDNADVNDEVPVWERPYRRGPAPDALIQIKSQRILRKMALPSLQRDFHRRCCFCTRSEDEIGGEENFTVEHFRPKSRFPELFAVYRNLYYCCNACNKFKGQTWPQPETPERKFVDPCEEAIYPRHLVIRRGGAIEPSAPPGPFMHQVLKFDVRPGIQRTLRRRESIKELKAAIAGGEVASILRELDTVIELVGMST